MYERYNELSAALQAGRLLGFIEEAARAASFQAAFDSRGNLVCSSGGGGVKFHVSLRHPCMAVQGVHEGYLLFDGDFPHPAHLANKPVVFQNGVKGLVGVKNKATFGEKTPDQVSFEDLYIDVGTKDEKILASCKQAYLDYPVSKCGKDSFLHPYASVLSVCACALSVLEDPSCGNVALTFSEAPGCAAGAFNIAPCRANSAKASGVQMGGGAAVQNVAAGSTAAKTQPAVYMPSENLSVIGIPVRNKGAILEMVSLSDMLALTALIKSIAQSAK